MAKKTTVVVKKKSPLTVAANKKMPVSGKKSPASAKRVSSGKKSKSLRRTRTVSGKKPVAATDQSATSANADQTATVAGSEGKRKRSGKLNSTYEIEVSASEMRGFSSFFSSAVVFVKLVKLAR